LGKRRREGDATGETSSASRGVGHAHIRDEDAHITLGMILQLLPTPCKMKTSSRDAGWGGGW